MVKRIFRSPLPIRPDDLSSPALFFRASPFAAQLVWPTSAQAGPSPGHHLALATEATTALPLRCRTTRRGRPPSLTRMERNRRAARLPSLSHTSSTPHRLPSPIQCRNRWGLKIHRHQPPPLPLHCTTPLHLVPLSTSPLCASTRPTPSTTTVVRSTLSPNLPHH
jgi:hypothetical protein